LFPVRLEAGETLQATYQQQGPGTDGVLALLSDCEDVGSCIVGRDNWSHDFPSSIQESLSYTNTSGNTEDLVLLLDSWSFANTFALQVSIF
jgi:hypothetical protein